MARDASHKQAPVSTVERCTVERCTCQPSNLTALPVYQQLVVVVVVVVVVGGWWWWWWWWCHIGVI